MDELKQKAHVTVVVKNDVSDVRILVPKTCLIDSDVSLIQAYLSARYVVSYFRSSLCSAGLDRCIRFRLKDSYFDADRFGYLLFSL